MKQLILSLSIVALMASCSDKPAENTSHLPGPDTSGLAAFNNWKEQQSAFEMEGINEVSVQPEIVEEKPAPVIIYRDAPVKRTVQPARKPAVVTAKPRTTQTSDPVREGVYRNDDQVNNSGTSGTSEQVGTGDNGTGTSTGTTGDVATAPQQKKEGWSKAAKGTAIGGASGAVVGAIISKNKTAGAIIGGVVGAAGGYVIGRSQDKKDGRY